MENPYKDDKVSLDKDDIPIGTDYKLIANNKIGSGVQSEIYLGKNLKNNQDVAIKLVNKYY